jgi:hypothetical protein
VISTVPPTQARSFNPHLAELRSIYLRNNDQAALAELNEFERKQASTRGSVLRYAIVAAPVVSVAVVVAIAALTNDHHSWTDYAHKARFGLAAAVPLAVKAVVSRFLG